MLNDQDPMQPVAVCARKPPWLDLIRVFVNFWAFVARGFWVSVHGVSCHA